MFWVNVPFCSSALVLAAKYLPKDTVAAVKPKLDILPVRAARARHRALILGLSKRGRGGWVRHRDVVVPLGNRRRPAVPSACMPCAKTEPIVDIRLFSHRSVATSSAVLFFSGFTLYGAMLCCRSSTRRPAAPPHWGAGIMLVPQGVGCPA